MPHFDIIKKASPSESFRIKCLMGTYDLQCNQIEERFIGDLELPEQWNIGLIVGSSGTGKTTIARELFGDRIIDGYEYTHDNILDDMPNDVSCEEIFRTLTSVGFSSVTSWMKPYNVLSNGEKMRCDLARAILEKRDFFVFDEFTSVVDRTVAKIGSFAIQKYMRKNKKRFIAVSCHEDIKEWLMPDWVFDTNLMEFQKLDFEIEKKNRPKLKLSIHETSSKDCVWRMFGKYHYLSNKFNKAAHVYVLKDNDKLVAMCAVLYFPHGYKKNTYREHRTVVMPDYQGCGIGNQFANFIAEMYVKKGYNFITTTSNPAMLFSRKKSRNWICTHFGRMGKGGNHSKIQNRNVRKSTSCDRITASFEYVLNNGD